MICQECNERPASVHFTKVVNGEKTVIQLCEHCAQEKGGLFMAEGAFAINDLLAGLLNIDPGSQHTQSPSSLTQQISQCEVCKMTFQQFVKVGHFGCANCYRAFKSKLTPIIKRLHSGNTHHGGKIPARIGGSIHLKKQVSQLKEEMQALVEAEEFEKAAEVRDQIRSLEKKLINGEEKSG